MTETPPQNEDDLSRRLKAWRVPDVSAHLDARVFSTYRGGRWSRQAWWRFLLTGSVRVPLPIAIGMALVCLVSIFAALRSPDAAPPAGSTFSRPAGGPSQTEPSEAQDAPERDLAGFKPTSELKVTILYPGDTR